MPYGLFGSDGVTAFLETWPARKSGSAGINILDVAVAIHILAI